LEEYSGEPSTPPYIIAIGPKKPAVQQYLIAVDGYVIPLIPGKGILDAFDLLIQVYHIFNIDYGGDYKDFFNYVQHFLYGIRNSQNTTMVSNVGLKFQNLMRETN
jgi:hypothetical protein